MSRKLLLVAVAAVSLAGATSQSYATVIGVTSPVSGVDTIDWSQLGPDFTVLSSPQAFVTDGGVTGHVSSTGGTFERRDEQSGWAGNFAPGTPLLWDAGVGPDITLTFDTPIFGFGSQINADDYGPFVARITNNVGDIFSFTENGVTTGANDGSAIFIGLLSDVANITSITFTLDSATGAPNDFAIGGSSSGTSPVPVPAALPLFAGAVGGLGIFGRWRKRRTTAAA